MNNKQRTKNIEEAVALVRQAKELVDEALVGTDARHHYHAYGCYGFSRLLNEGNPYDEGLVNLIAEMEELDNE